MCNYSGEWEDYINASSPVLNNTGNFSKDFTSLNSTSLCFNESLANSSLQETKEISEQDPLIFIMDVVFTIGFTFIVIFGTSGNAIVLWIVIGHRQMWNSTNYFLVNLSIADLLMAVANTLFNFIYMRDKHWPFGSIYCTFNNFISYVTVAASVLTLIAITLDRYRAIIFPLRPKLSRLFLLCSILAIWVASFLLALPSLLYSKVLSNGKVSACLLLWPDGLPFNSTQDYVYNIVFFLLTYLLPMFLMGFCYTRMGKHLWGTPIIGEETPQLLKNYQNKKKVVKMFLIIVVVFGVCWLPYHVYFIYYYHDKSIVKFKYISQIFLGFYWLAMANTMVNPIIYYWMNTRFRKYFIRVLMFLPRIFCGKNLGRDWEGQKTNNTLQLKQLNGASNFNSQLSNINDVHGRSNGHPSLSHSNLARSRSMKEGLDKDTKRDVTFQSGFGNSLFPQRQSRLTSSCRSSLNSPQVNKTNLKDTLKERVGDKTPTGEIKVNNKLSLGNALSLPVRPRSAECQYLDGLERAESPIKDRACPQLIVTSPTSEDDGSYKLDSSEQVSAVGDLMNNSWDTNKQENRKGSFDYAKTFKIPKGLLLWTKLKGGLHKFGKKSETKLDTSNLIVPATSSTFQDAASRTMKNDSNCAHTCNKISIEVENGPIKLANNVHFKNDNSGNYDVLPVIQVQPIFSSKLDDEKDNSVEASEITSVTVHSPPSKIKLSQSQECIKNADSLYDTLSIGSSVQEKSSKSSTEDMNDQTSHVIEVAGGHKISAKKVSVSTISVTFTDEIDAYTNHSSEHCSTNHGDRTAVIDLLAFSGSSQFNNEEFETQNKNKDIPENLGAVSIDPYSMTNGKNGVNLCNGVVSNQTVQGVKHICNNSSNKSKDQYDTISSIPPTLLASSQHQFIINSNRQDSKNSITLNHRYREDDGGHGTELRVYRYDGWQSGLSHTSCNGTKSTLV